MAPSYKQFVAKFMVLFCVVVLLLLHVFDWFDPSFQVIWPWNSPHLEWLDKYSSIIATSLNGIGIVASYNVNKKKSTI